jgi:hypothetical protein
LGVDLYLRVFDSAAVFLLLLEVLLDVKEIFESLDLWGLF